MNSNNYWYSLATYGAGVICLTSSVLSAVGWFCVGFAAITVVDAYGRFAAENRK